MSNELIQRFHFFSKYDLHTLEEFESIIKVNRKQLILDIDRINDILKKYELNQFSVNQDVIYSPKINLSDLFCKMDEELSDYIFQEERGSMILLYLFFNREYVSNYDLQQLLRVSKNSVLSDIKLLRALLSDKGVDLKYSRKQGYYLTGKPIELRNILGYSVVSLLTFEIGSLIIRYVANYSNNSISFDKFTESIISVARRLKINFISDKSREVWYLLAVLNKVKFQEYVTYQKNIIIDSSSWAAIDFTDEIIGIYPNLRQEKDFILSRVLGCISGNLIIEYDNKIYKTMLEIMGLVRVNTGVEFEDSAQFRKNLYSHLLPSYYRLVFDNTLVNPYKEQIMDEYESLFYLVKKSLKPLEMITNKSINDDEVAYFTIHFGGYLEVKSSDKKKRLKALTVCPNGISSSLIMKAELQQLFPSIIFNEIHQLDKIESVNTDSYDVIFSTIYIESLKPVYIVQPLMNSVEKSLLKKQLYKDFEISIEESVSIETILKIVERHAKVENKKSLKEDLYRYFIGKSVNEKQEGFGLDNLINEKFIQQKSKVVDWKNAIEVAAKPLLDAKYIEKTYIDAMIESVNQSGSYIVLAPSVAVPHASPEDGVNKLGISLLQLEQPVDFNLNDDFEEEKLVRLLFVLAPVDSVSHLKALQQLALILENEEPIQKLIQAKTKSEIIEIIKQEIVEEE